MATDRTKPPIKQFAILVVLVALLVVGAKTYGRKNMDQAATPTAAGEVSEATKVRIATAKGDIVIDVYEQDAPKAAKNFVELTRRGYYNGLTFHRVEPGFVVQGGDPSGNGTGGESIYGPTFEDELNPDTPSAKEGYKKGVVAMANSGPNTNGSQFFIMLEDNPELPHLYTIFGKVVEGQEVVDKIAVGDRMEKVTVEE